MTTPADKPKGTPGRKKIHADAAAKQRAYRVRRKKAGKPADTRQDTIASLRDEIARLTIDHGNLAAQRKLLEASKAALAERVAAVAEREAALSHAKPPDDRKLRDLEFKVRELERERDQWRFRKADKLRELLGKPFLMPKRQLAAVFLVDYLGKPIEQGYEFERATKEALEFGRKAATAGGAIAEIAARLERHRQLNEGERAILDAARAILSNIHNRATVIKESAKSDSQRIKREEAARAKAAAEAVTASFPKLEADAVHLAYYLGGSRYVGSGYHLGELRKMRPETARKWDIDYHLEQLAGDVRNALNSRVEKSIKAGQNAREAAQSLVTAFEAARPEVEADNKVMLDQINICRVAAMLAEANKPKA